MVAITHIDIETKMASGWPVLNNCVDQMSMLTVPVTRLMKTEVNLTCLSNSDRQVLQLVRDEAQRGVLESLSTSITYRRLYRKSSLSSHMKAEIQKALHKSHRVHRWDIGLVDPDVDSEAFGVNFLERSSARFCYKDGNLSQLDELLGDNWDLAKKGNSTVFVTAVTVRCRHSLLTAVIHSATFPGPVTPGSHRIILSKHMTETALTLTAPIIDDTE